MGSFADKVNDWAEKTPQRIQAVRNRAIELLAENMARTQANGGLLPHKTGNLMRSLLASTAPIMTNGKGPFAGSDVGAVIAGLALDETVWLGFQANYAFAQNYGFFGTDSLGRQQNLPGNYFIEFAIATWPMCIYQANSELQAGRI